MGQSLVSQNQQNQEEQVGQLDEGHHHPQPTILPTYQQQQGQGSRYLHNHATPAYQQTGKCVSFHNEIQPQSEKQSRSQEMEPQQKTSAFENTHNSYPARYSISEGPVDPSASDPRFGSSQSRYMDNGSTSSGPAWLYSYPKQVSVLSPYTSLEFHYLDPQTLPLQPVPVSLEVNAEAMRAMCPNCSKFVLTVPKHRVGLFTTITEDMLCIMGPCFFLPFCKINIWHECPNCKHVIATTQGASK